MFRHHLILALRNFRRNKTSFLINLIGLSTGLACVLFIYLWVNDEWNMDKFHEKDDQLYKVMQNFHLPQGISTMDDTPVVLADALAAERPEVEAALSICSEGERPTGILANDGKEFAAEGLFAGNNFFEIFTYELINGNEKELLKNKSSIVISEELAIKLFNTTENIIGKTIAWRTQYQDTTYQVTGVFKPATNNSFKPFDFLLNMEVLLDLDEWAGRWNATYAETFLLLKKGTDINQFNKSIADFLRFKDPKITAFELFVQKYSDEYLFGNYENGLQAGGRIAYVKLFSLIALFILLIACVNFMNLSTARASLKMKEVGVKKTIGASRSELIVQFMGESIILSFLALIFAVQLVVILLPYFNEITGKNLELIMDIKSGLSILGIVLITGILSGSYSAFYLSGFNPVAVLKGKTINSASEQWVRKGLVVFQFSLSVIFIVGVLVIHQQMEFIQTKNLGFERDHVLSFQRENFNDKPEEFLAALKNIPGVIHASSMFGDIFSGTSTQSGYSWKGDESDQKYLFKSPIIGYNVIETLGMELLSGRSYSREFKEENSKIIINESAQKMMGLENPIGKIIGYTPEQRQIIGVVKDFNYGSVHHKIEPLIFRFAPRFGNNILVKIKAGTEKNTIEQIGTLYKDFHPAAYPFQYSFLDADYQKLYESENRIAILSKYFSGMAIIISCLGLFGLATFTAERRKKEIGIRKVLGSSAFRIVRMLSGDFTKTVMIAIFISLPLSYFFVNKWLANFAYTIELNSWFFLLPGLAVLLIAWGTVGLQTIKAARINPVECLKEE
ncbi:MAG: ABC transporter permease [Saprospiraceae bacterium]